MPRRGFVWEIGNLLGRRMYEVGWINNRKMIIDYNFISLHLSLKFAKAAYLTKFTKKLQLLLITDIHLSFLFLFCKFYELGECKCLS